MNRIVRHGTAMLLCVALLLSIAPAVFAEEAINFGVVLERGNTEQNSIYVVTEPKYYTGNVAQFQGDYAVYQDVESGYLGIIDYKGNILYRGAEDKPVPYSVIGKNLFFGDMEANYGFLYDFSGNLVFDTHVLKTNVGQYSDMVTGELLGYWIGDEKAYGYGVILDPTDFHELATNVGEAWNGVVCCRVNEEWGLRYLAGGEILPCVYSTLYFITQDKLLGRKDGVYCLIAPDGSLLEELNCTDVTYYGYFVNGAQICCLFIEQNGKYGILQEDGSLIAAPEFDNLDFIGWNEESGYPYSFFAEQNGETILYHGYRDKIVPAAEDKDAWIPLPKQGLYLIDEGLSWSLVNENGTPLLNEKISWVAAKTKSCLALVMEGGVTVRVYDWDMNLLAEIPVQYVYSTNDGFVVEYRQDENRVEFYNAQGELAETMTGVVVASCSKGCLVLKREDQKYAFVNGNGQLLTDYIYSFVIEISSGWDGLPYPYFVATRGSMSEIIDGRTGKNALFEGCGVEDVYVLQEGSYFPIFANGKTGVARITKRGESPFRDVKKKDWYAAAVRFCANAGLVGGTGSGSFSPKVKMSRAMLVQVLYSISGEKTASYGFSDVKSGKWYTDAVNWAATKGIVGGTGNGKFSPDATVTREQMVSILYRYAGVYVNCAGNLTVLEPFSDVGKISDYAREAFAWAIENGMIAGTGDGKLNPKGTADRAQVATILMRFVEYMASCQAS